MHFYRKHNFIQNVNACVVYLLRILLCFVFRALLHLCIYCIRGINIYIFTTLRLTHNHSPKKRKKRCNGQFLYKNTFNRGESSHHSVGSTQTSNYTLIKTRSICVYLCTFALLRSHQILYTFLNATFYKSRKGSPTGFFFGA